MTLLILSDLERDAIAFGAALRAITLYSEPHLVSSPDSIPEEPDPEPFPSPESAPEPDADTIPASEPSPEQEPVPSPS